MLLHASKHTLFLIKTAVPCYYYSPMWEDRNKGLPFKSTSCTHTLSCNEKDSGTNHQETAHHIEGGIAYTTG